MQTPSDIVLLQRWQHQQDALAFRTLTQRYGALVFGICNRVLQNAADAEEITQDCFLKLAQNPGNIDRSVGPWLHSVAVNAAISRIRSEQRRRTREAVHESARAQSMEYSARDLFEHVDEAISQLPDAQRDCVVGYFLEGKPRHDVAAALGVSTKTVQRKTDEAIEKIREILGQRGITTSAGALAITMAGLNVDALPTALGVALGKIAVAGHTSAAARAVAVQATTTGGTTIMRSSLALAVCGTILVGGIWWNIDHNAAPVTPEPVAEMASAPSKASAANPGTAAQAGLPPAVANAVIEATASAAMAPEASFALARSLAEAIVPIANPTRFAALRGLVTDGSERPVAGAMVTLLVAGVSLEELGSLQVEGFPPAASLASSSLGTRRRDAARDALFALPDHRYTAETDELGQFLIEGIRYKGHAMIGVEAENFALTQQSIEVVENAAEEVKFALTPGKLLLGRLVAPSGEPVVGAHIGVYSVKVTSPDPIPAMELRGESSKSTRKAGRASSSGGSGGGVGIGGGGGGGFGVGGFAVGSGGNVSLGAVNRPAIIPAFLPRTDETGHFSLTAAAAGGKIAVSLVADSDTHGTATFLDVPVGSDEAVVLNWENGVANIDGHVLLSNGEPASGHYVHLRGTIRDGVVRHGQTAESQGVSGSELFLATDEDGRFLRTGIAAHETFVATIYDSTGRKRGSAELPAFEQGMTLTWSHTLSPPLKATGTVMGVPSGKPVADAQVWVRPLRAPREGEWDMEEVTTDLEGGFTLDLAGDEGDYVVTATLSPWWDEKAGTEVALRYDASAELALEIPDPWERTFRLIAPDGAPIAGVVVQLEQALANGARSQIFLKDVVSDRDGRVTLGNLAVENLTMARFTLEGYLDGKSTERGGAAGERCPEEVITLYPRTGFAARLLDEAGQPYADRDAVILARYGNGEELIHTVATDGEGWLVLQRHLPATSVTLEIRLTEEQELNPNLTMANFGSMPDHYRQEMLRQTLRDAALTRTPHATVSELRLEEDGENEIGDLVLKVDAEAGEE